MKHPVLI